MMNEFVWKKQETIAEVGNMKEEMRKVLVIYTGGTIGMKLTTECGKRVSVFADIIDSRGGGHLCL